MDDGAQVFHEILDALVVELSKPRDSRDIHGIANFMDSFVMRDDGPTLLDRFAPLARTPEALARLSVKLIDARLTTGPAWEGIRDVLAHLRGTKTPTEGR
jgi:hypothetical protein